MVQCLARAGNISWLAWAWEVGALAWSYIRSTWFSGIVDVDTKPNLTEAVIIVLATCRMWIQET